MKSWFNMVFLMLLFSSCGNDQIVKNLEFENTRLRNDSMALQQKIAILEDQVIYLAKEKEAIEECADNMLTDINSICIYAINVNPKIKSISFIQNYNTLSFESDVRGVEENVYKILEITSKY